MDTRSILALAADAGAQGHNQDSDLFAREHFIEAGPFDIQDLAFDRQDSLKFSVAALFGRATGRITLDDEYFAVRRIFLGTIGQLAG